jgi:hypothetical protein
MQSWTDELSSINEKWLNGEYATYEDYQKALADCNSYYTEKLE